MGGSVGVHELIHDLNAYNSEAEVRLIQVRAPEQVEDGPPLQYVIDDTSVDEIADEPQILVVLERVEHLDMSTSSRPGCGRAYRPTGPRN